MLKFSGIICLKFGLLVVLIGWQNVGRERESEWMSGSYWLEQFIWNNDLAFGYAWLLTKCEKQKEKSTITIIKQSKTIWILFFTLPMFDC